MFLPTTIPQLLCLTAVLILMMATGGLAKNKHKYAEDAPSLSPPPAIAPNNNRSAASSSVYYDQRQTGKYNINVNIKDVAIISIDPQTLAGNVGDSTSDDGDYYEDYYDYDMDDFTVSPIAALLGGLTTKKPKTTTTSTTSLEDVQNSSSSTSASSESTLSSSESAPTSAESLSTASGAINDSAPITTKTTVQTLLQHSSTIAAATSTEQQTPSSMPKLQENEIPVHIVMDGESSSSGGRRRSQHQKRRRQSGAVRRQNQPLASDASSRCARGQARDENGRCPAATGATHGRRRVGMQKVMDLLTLLTPNAKA